LGELGATDALDSPYVTLLAIVIWVLVIATIVKLSQEDTQVAVVLLWLLLAVAALVPLAV
jgi:hypothetical protein